MQLGVTPLNTELKKVIGTEVSMLLYYLLSIGIPFWIVYSIRKKKTGETTFNLTIENTRIIPFIIIGTMALLFGLVHLNPWQFVTGFIVGIFSGWVYYKTRSLLPSIIIHAAANLSGFVMRSFTDIEASLDETLLETYGGAANLILAIAGSIIILLVCIYYLKKEFQFDDEKIDQNISEYIVNNPKNWNNDKLK